VNVQEACQETETKIQEAQRLLADPRPETLELCLSELGHAVAILEQLVAGSSRDWTPAAAASFHRIRSAASRLNQQIAHGSNVCLGWMQLQLSTGYTQHGRPEFAQNRARNSFEV
jgi:hypothetical protein